MTKVTKRRLKVKKKNMTIFIIITMFLIFSLYEIGFVVYKVITTSQPKVEEKDNKKTSKKELTAYEEKLKELDGIDKKITYFRKNNIDRYLKYKKNNPDMSNIKVIKNVNMNLDLIPYEDKFKALNLGKNTVLVNKYYYLEEDYEPDNLETISKVYALAGMKLVSPAKNAFEEMCKDASKEDLKIVAMSAYRSYEYQIDLYARYERQDGKDKADSYSGRPGHSEHQTGLAVDVYNEEETYTNFENTKEFNWMQEHAHEYGFILRFPKDKVNETGYVYESWHYRYVGVKIATYIQENNITLEEYIATH